MDGARVFAGAREVVGQHDALALARLLQVLPGQKVAQSAGAGYDATVRGESLFVLDGQPVGVWLSGK